MNPVLVLLLLSWAHLQGEHGTFCGVPHWPGHSHTLRQRPGGLTPEWTGPLTTPRTADWWSSRWHWIPGTGRAAQRLSHRYAFGENTGHEYTGHALCLRLVLAQTDITPIYRKCKFFSTNVWSVNHRICEINHRTYETNHFVISKSSSLYQMNHLMIIWNKPPYTWNKPSNMKWTTVYLK